MRAAAILCLCFALLAGCASGRAAAPRQYLDETTAATVTVTAAPWIFSRERPEIAVNLRDYVSLHAIDVNVTGRHRMYLVAEVWSTLDRRPEGAPGAPRLEIAADGRLFSFAQPVDDPRSIGIGRLHLPDAAKGTSQWLYPIEPHDLAFLAESTHVSTRLSYGELHVDYEPWRDGRAQVRSLLEATPR